MSISESARAQAPNPCPTVLRPRRLVGRDGELRDVSESVTSAPVTTLVGPGGVGKTALAITVAAACSQDFPGGVTVVAASAAVQLFRQRAGARALGALVTERTCRLFGEICRRVDGLPLAIELAAARVASLDPGDIASNLDDLFTLLPQRARRPDGAQRSLRATVEWSDALLAEEKRRLLRRMGVFAGSFDLGAV